MRARHLWLVVLALATHYANLAPARAQTVFQGVRLSGAMTDQNGTPLAAGHKVTALVVASLVPVGGEELRYAEEFTLADDTGNVRVMLGAGQGVVLSARDLVGALTPDVGEALPRRYLALRVRRPSDGMEEELSPRRLIAAVPFAGIAQTAVDATALGGAPAASYVRTTELAAQLSTFARTSGGAVTFGESAPVTFAAPQDVAPFLVSSTTLVQNLNAQLLGGQAASYYTNAANFSGVLAAEVVQSSGLASTQTTNVFGAPQTFAYGFTATSGGSPVFTVTADGAISFVGTATGTVTNALTCGVAELATLAVHATEADSCTVFTGALTGDASGTQGATRVVALQGRALSSIAPTVGQAIVWNGSQWAPASAAPASDVGGDLAGTTTAASVVGIQSRPVSSTLPSGGQALTWNSTLSAWEPAAIDPALGGDLGGTAQNATVARLQGRAVSSAAPTTGQVLTWNGAQWEAGASTVSVTTGGDLSGTASNATVTRIQNRSVSAAVPAGGQALVWNAAQSRWEPALVNPVTGGDLSGPAASATVLGLAGRTLSSAAPSGGQAMVWNESLARWEPSDVDPSMAGDVSGAASAATVTGLRGRPLSSGVPQPGQSLTWDGASWIAGAPMCGGDLAGDVASASVVRLRGRNLAATAPIDGQVLTWNASSSQWEGGNPSVSVSTGGDLAGIASNATVVGLQTRAVSNSAPASLQALVWNAALSRWEPGSPGVGGDLGGSAIAATVARLQGRTLSSVAPSGGQVLTWNATSGEWQPGNPTVGITTGGDLSGAASSATVVGIQSRPVASTLPTSGQGLVWNGIAWAPGSETVGGDLSGTAGLATVARLQGRTVAPTAPASGQVLTWNAGLSSWEPGSPNVAVSTGGDLFGASSSATVIRIQNRDVSAAAPTSGQGLVWNAGASRWEPGSETLGGDLLGSASNATVAALRGRDVAATAPASGQGLVWNAATSEWEPGSEAVGGDLSGSASAATVARIQGRTVSSSAPASGQVLAWNNAQSRWEPSAVAASLSGDVTGSLPSTVVGAIQGRSVSAAAPATGESLVWNGTSWAPGSPAGGGDLSGDVDVASVVGLRGRAISAAAPGSGQTLIYNAGLTTWEPGSPQVTAAGDVTGPIGTTTVARLQNRNLASTAPGGGQVIAWNAGATRWEPSTAAGDVSGSFGALAVTRLQGRSVSSAAPSSGQGLVWNGSTWAPGTPSVSLGGDVTGASTSNTVTALRNRTISTTVPANNQAYVYNTGTTQWGPTSVAILGGANTFTAGNTFQGGSTFQTGAVTLGSTTSVTSALNVQSAAALNVNASAALNVQASGVLSVKSSGSVSVESGGGVSVLSGATSTFANNPGFSGTPGFSGIPNFTNATRPFNASSSGLVTNLNSEFVGGYRGTDVVPTVGARTFSPCVMSGTNVSCTGPCTFNATNGNVSCGATTSPNCQSRFSQSCPTDQNDACYLSCVGRFRSGWGFGSMPTATIPAAVGTSPAARLYAQIGHQVLYCPTASSVHSFVFTFYLYSGGTSPVIFTGTIPSAPNSGFVETPPFRGEADVTPGVAYSVWVAMTGIGDTTAPCWLVRPEGASYNNLVLLRYTRARTGL